jgi:ankyrin repeat protein
MSNLILIQAAEAGDAKRVEHFLDSGADINERDDLGCTALYEAVSSEHRHIVELLLARGADPNIPENNGTTPLMEAASSGGLELIRILLAAGADVSARDHFDDSALEYASAQSHNTAVDLLRISHDAA